MKYKGLILAAVMIVAAAALFMTPETQDVSEIAVVGAPAPDFELTDETGKLWKLADLKGKAVFINFWATWCTTCKAEMPHKARMKEMLKDRPIQMFGVLFRDDQSKLAAYFKKNVVTSPTLIDPGNAMSKLYGITGVPESFLIDKEGILRERFVGPKEWGDEATMTVIEKWL